GAVAAFVRVAALRAAGDDGVTGQTARLDDGDVYDAAQFLGGQRHTVVGQFAVPANFRGFEGLDSLGEADFGHNEGAADFFDFIGAFELALREDAALLDADFDVVVAQFAGQAIGEIGGNKNL